VTRALVRDESSCWRSIQVLYYYYYYYYWITARSFCRRSMDGNGAVLPWGIEFLGTNSQKSAS